MNYQSILEATIQAVDFHSPTVFSWFGRRSEDVHTQIRRSLSPESARSYLHHNLKMRLYKDFYCKGHPSPSGPELMGAPVRRTPLAHALSQANHGQGYWSQGWQMQQPTSKVNDSAVLQRHGLSLQVPSSDYQAIASPPDSSQLAVHFPKEFWGMSLGHYMAVSDVELIPTTLGELVRIYWNVTPEGAVPLMNAITTVLNQDKSPFRFKVLNDPARFNRCDAAVLYIDQENFRDVFAQLQASVYPIVAPFLNAGTPAFTKPLAEGIGLAEEPGNGESFGLDRCRILAEGLIQAHENGAKTLGDRRTIVMAQFAAANLSLDEPYLQTGTTECYAVSFPQWQPTPKTGTISIAPKATHPERFLNTAESIAEGICKDAIWFENQCTWLGAEADSLNQSTTLSTLTHRSLGPHLYDGTSGVALFLGELSTLSPNPEFKRTALGAIHHALAQLESCPAPVRRGLYIGWIGIAVAAARLGKILRQPALLEKAHDIVTQVSQEAMDSNHFDLLAGLAGGIKGLLILHELLPNEIGCLELAKRWGQDLIEKGTKSSRGYSWGSPKQSRKTHLTGWSHGTSGVASALLNLYQATQDESLLQIVHQAFDYERHWFNSEVGNWPDLRQVTHHQHRHLPYMSAWCHGAPGIALARLQAHTVLGKSTYQEEAIAALKTTREGLIAGMQQSAQSNFSLCHGLAGNMEILLLGSQQLGHDVNVNREFVEAIADEARTRYGDNQPWPCGVHSRGETPNLMLGFAGIGYFYLRLYCPEVPSLLMPQADALCQDIKTISNQLPKRSQVQTAA